MSERDASNFDPHENPRHVDADDFRSSPASDDPSGAKILTAYAKRRVTAYPIYEHEIKTLSAFNTLSATCFSFMSGFISFAVGIWTNSTFTAAPTPEGVIMSHVVAPFCCLTALIAACLGIWFIRSRSNTLEGIRRESAGQG